MSNLTDFIGGGSRSRGNGGLPIMPTNSRERSFVIEDSPYFESLELSGTANVATDIIFSELTDMVFCGRSNDRLVYAGTTGAKLCVFWFESSEGYRILHIGASTTLRTDITPHVVLNDYVAFYTGDSGTSTLVIFGFADSAFSTDIISISSDARFVSSNGNLMGSPYKERNVFLFHSFIIGAGSTPSPSESTVMIEITGIDAITELFNLAKAHPHKKYYHHTFDGYNIRVTAADDYATYRKIDWAANSVTEQSTAYVPDPSLVSPIAYDDTKHTGVYRETLAAFNVWQDDNNYLNTGLFVGKDKIPTTAIGLTLHNNFDAIIQANLDIFGYRMVDNGDSSYTFKKCLIIILDSVTHTGKDFIDDNVTLLLVTNTGDDSLLAKPITPVNNSNIDLVLLNASRDIIHQQSTQYLANSGAYIENIKAGYTIGYKVVVKGVTRRVAGSVDMNTLTTSVIGSI